MKRYYMLYKTTNLINGKYYIGCHATKKLNDGYIGSGKNLKRAVTKYGRENFKRDILFLFNCSELMYAFEEIVVCKEVIKEDCCYNLKIGGFGIDSEAAKKSVKLRKERLASDLEYKRRWSESHSKATKEAYRCGKMKPVWLGKSRPDQSEKMKGKSNPNFGGKAQTGETRKKISEKAKARKYRLLWVSNEQKRISTLVKDECLMEYISKGWVRGRKYVNKDMLGKFASGKEAK